MLSLFLKNPVLILQTFLLAVSIFNLIAFLWLACTVWLNGDRRSMIARVGVVGLSLSALFFFIHALLVSGTLVRNPGFDLIDFLWHLIWFPAIGVPYIWFVIGLHYAALINAQWRRRRPLLLAWSAFLGCSVLALLIANQSTFTFRDTLLLLAYGAVHKNLHVSLFSPLILLPLLFLCYVTFCALGPWFTPGRIGRLIGVLWKFAIRRQHHPSLRRNLVDAFWNDPVDVDHLKEPILSWHLARPILLLAALLMVCLTVSLGGLGVWSMFSWLHMQASAHQVVVSPVTLITIPLNLILLDILATGSVALIVLLIGYSIVRHGILIERPLARRGFFEQWRGIVIVATTIAIFIALLVLLTRSSLGALLLITSIATGTYALFTWSSYTAHDRYIALLGPFLRSTNLRHWLNTDLQKTEQNMEALFSHLCKDVLEVQCARLVVLAGPIRRDFDYRWSILDSSDAAEEQERSGALEPSTWQEKRSHTVFSYKASGQQQSDIYAYRIRLSLRGVPVICWILPIYDELGLVAKLYLGPRKDGGVFTNEDMDLAQACGQRILDTLRDHEAMLAVAGLLRRRIVDVKLLGAQQRRVLHDEILPMLHLALLRLETVHSLSGQESIASDHSEQVLDDAIGSISTAHRQLAAMMRAMATGAPHRLERDGMMHAIHTMLEQDFQHAFDTVEWHVSEEVASCIDDLVPPAIAELIFAAVQEALRNAARHARGADIHRRLNVTLEASCNPDLEVVVTDDGVGIISVSSSTTGTGGGLLTHSALLAIAGGNLTVKTAPGEGVAVRIFLPIEAVR
jgi:signal transduction histidine kinase